MPLFRELADRGLGVLLVEQFAALALGIGNQGYVMSRGEIRLSDTAAKLAREPERLHAAYLGGAVTATGTTATPIVGRSVGAEGS